ncbi:P1 family peptidase [Flavisphingomonas formosensis]|uniref:P1 family peptidase n=1 Tax=Flavisphingomonas formosensis TaxID=861534 RepID=UPI0012F801BE|nr:P1 family peptidase [Sphingomonas formosensis]
MKTALLTATMIATLSTALPAATPQPPYGQAALQPVVETAGPALQFDWPMIRIGSAQYREGPTGVTVFRFGKKVMGAVDVRGGGPGTVNTDYLRLGYETPDLDAVVFSGGSWYGLESTTAVDTALKDDGIRGGKWDDIGLAVGAIVYDFGPRRLNEIYPDKALAQAAYRAAQPGVFRLGAAGAGRFTETGDFFGCKAHSGQGGAFRQIGDLKIAAFTVVNAIGVITRRDGGIAACYPAANWPADLKVPDLMNSLPESRKPDWAGAKRNTTVSLIVVNQKLPVSELQRLATQVHTSMARGIQPFATMFDGDVLYAVSTEEIDPPAKGGISSPELGAIASEVMWDAVLASVPPQPPVVPAADAPPAGDPGRFAGSYVFSPFASLKVSVAGGRLMARATGQRDVYDIGRMADTELKPTVEAGSYTVPGRYPLVLRFDREGTLTINPGPWQQVSGKRAR